MCVQIRNTVQVNLDALVQHTAESVCVKGGG